MNTNLYRYVFVPILLVLVAACGGGSSGSSSGGGDTEDTKIADLNELNGAKDVGVDSVFEYTFDKAVDTDTVNTSTFFIVRAAAGSDASVCDPFNAIAATDECASTTLCSIDPENDLTYETSYAVCLTTGITYADGTSFSAKSFSFVKDDPVPEGEGEAEVITFETGESEEDMSCTSNADCTGFDGYPTCDTGEGVCVEENFLNMHAASIVGYTNHMLLTWNAPSETGGPADEGVFIRRSEGDSVDDCPESDGGTLVYNGSEQTFTDLEAAENGLEYCYRIWYDNDGEYGVPPAGGVTQVIGYVDSGPAALMFHNQSTGSMLEWRLGNDGSRKSYGKILERNVSPTHWQVEGLIDLDAVDEEILGEPRLRVKDMVWRNTSTGGLYYWLMNVDGTIKDAGAITTADGTPVRLSNHWQVVGLANLNPGNEDGHDSFGDIVFYNTEDYYLYYWLLQKTDDGVSILGTCDADGKNPGCADCTNACAAQIKGQTNMSHWTIEAIGNLLENKANKEFDPDPNAEILFRHKSTGELKYWKLDDHGLYSSSISISVVYSPSTTWQIEAVEDLDDNGSADILWRSSSSHKVNIWFLYYTGGILAVPPESRHYANADGGDGTVGATWQVKGIVKVDSASGYRDIIWRQTSSGRLLGWGIEKDEDEPTHFGIANSHSIATTLSSNWEIFALTEY